MKRIATIVTVAVVATAAAAKVPDRKVPEQNLQQIEQDLATEQARQQSLEKKAADLSRELAELRGRLVQTADEASRLENELAGLEERLAELEADERQRTERLHANRRQTADLLGALERMARTPTQALASRPEGPEAAVRSALLLRTTVPALHSRAQSLAEELRGLAETRDKLAVQRHSIQQTRTALDSRQQDLAALVERREQLSRQTESERIQVAQRMARLTGQTTDLRQLMDRIEAENQKHEGQLAARLAPRPGIKPAAPPPAAESPATMEAPAKAELAMAVPDKPAEQPENGKTDSARPDAAQTPETATLRLPVGGRVLIRYGDTDRYGATSRGLTISSRPGATVVAPLAGSVQFAGPFRGYGQILIVEHGNGYHSLLAGLGRIDTAVGQQLSAGEPVGVMGSPTDGNPDLYFELRRNGQPVDPKRSLSAQDGKGQG